MARKSRLREGPGDLPEAAQLVNGRDRVEAGSLASFCELERVVALASCRNFQSRQGPRLEKLLPGALAQAGDQAAT